MGRFTAKLDLSVVTAVKLTKEKVTSFGIKKNLMEWVIRQKSLDSNIFNVLQGLSTDFFAKLFHSFEVLG